MNELSLDAGALAVRNRTMHEIPSCRFERHPLFEGSFALIGNPIPGCGNHFERASVVGVGKFGGKLPAFLGKSPVLFNGSHVRERYQPGRGLPVRNRAFHKLKRSVAAFIVITRV